MIDNDTDDSEFTMKNKLSLNICIIINHYVLLSLISFGYLILLNSSHKQATI